MLVQFNLLEQDQGGGRSQGGARPGEKAIFGESARQLLAPSLPQIMVVLCAAA